MFGSNFGNKDNMKSNLGAESSRRKVRAAASNKSPTIKKELFCKYCNKKFPSYQALGGHHNAHKDERAAEKEKNILSMASAYFKKSSVGGFANSNRAYGFGGKTLGVSPLSMTRFKPLNSWLHKGVTHDYHHLALPGHQILNPLQPTMHQFQTLMARGSGSNQQYKPYQPLFSSTGPNSGSQPHSLHPSLCDEGNFGQASNSLIIPQNAIIECPDLNVRPLCDNENSGQENSSSSVNGTVEKLDLTLKF